MKLPELGIESATTSFCSKVIFEGPARRLIVTGPAVVLVQTMVYGAPAGIEEKADAGLLMGFCAATRVAAPATARSREERAANIVSSKSYILMCIEKLLNR